MIQIGAFHERGFCRHCGYSRAHAYWQERCRRCKRRGTQLWRYMICARHLLFPLRVRFLTMDGRDARREALQ